MAHVHNAGSLIGKINCYLQIVSKDPHSTAFVPLAEAFRQIGLLDDSLEAARIGTAALPNFSPGFATLGRILGQMGRLDEAMVAYQQALAIDRQSQSALVGLARLHLLRGERQQARQVLEQAAEFHPQDEMIESMLLALDLPRPWATPAAAVALMEPVAVASDMVQVGEEAAVTPIPTATLAEIYAKQGLTDQAVRVYEEIVRQEPGNTVANERLRQLRGDAVEPPVAVAPVPPVAVRREPLAVLEGWLQAIAMRRAHVQ